MKIDVIIPAYNEEAAVGKVVADIPRQWVREVIVVDNNSTDHTAANAAVAGATVLQELEQGYGAACLKAMEYISKKEEQPDIVVFLDADYSDFPQELERVVQPIFSENAEMVIGSRTLGNAEKGSLMPQQVFGNKLATQMIRFIYNVHYTDLGPFRAIKYSLLQQLEMKDRNYGWTVEMQVKAAKKKIKFTEVPVSYRKRIGASKVSGTFKGSVLAGYKIIKTILKYS